MAYLAMHPVANFVVQAFLSAVKKSPQVRRPTLETGFWLQEISDILPLPSKQVFLQQESYSYNDGKF